MSLTKIVAAKEFKGYFKNYSAYIILGIYLVLSAALTFFSANFFEYNNQNLVSLFLWQPDILNILIPALTMKMWAEERRYGTLELLLTQPINIHTLVLGKFFAAWGFSVLLVIMLTPFIVCTSFLVPLDILNISVSVLAVILVSATLCAMGCLISAYFKNAAAAYLASVFFGWVLENMNLNIFLKPIIKIFPILTQRLKGILDFREHYDILIQGQLSFESVVYFFSFALLILWLNTIVIKRCKR